MLHNYLKIAWRNLSKQPLYTTINLFGLSIGLTCFIMLSLYIQYETSYDQQHPNKDRIFRVSQIQKGNTFRGTDHFAVAPVNLAPAISENFPEVEATTTISDAFLLFFKDNETYYESGIYADAGLFDIFNYSILEGDPRLALKDKNAIVLTRSLVEKYFTKQSALGKEIKLEGEQVYTIQAVIEDIPKNQQIQFDYIIPLTNYDTYIEDRDRWKWASNNYWVYLLLEKGYDYKAIGKKLSIFEDQVKAAYTSLPFHPEYYLEPLEKIYLHSEANNQPGVSGDIRQIYLAACLGLIILILALINYMNLATARYKQRAKEVGMRKVLGANRRQLVYQFIMESTTLTILSIFIALALTNLLLPFFNKLVNIDIVFSPGKVPSVLLISLLFAIVLSSFSGLYPALKTSGIPTNLALKGKLFATQKDGRLVANILMVGQFSSHYAGNMQFGDFRSIPVHPKKSIGLQSKRSRLHSLQ